MVHVNKSWQQGTYNNNYYNYTDNDHYYYYILVPYCDFVIMSIICYHLLMVKLLSTFCPYVLNCCVLSFVSVCFWFWNHVWVDASNLPTGTNKVKSNRNNDKDNKSLLSSPFQLSLVWIAKQFFSFSAKDEFGHMSIDLMYSKFI